MGVSWNSISAGAMTAAVSLGTTLQQFGASATAAAQTVTAGGLQAMGQGAAAAATQAATQASTAATQAAAQATTAMATAATPHAVNATAASTAKLATDLAYVEKPAKAMAAAVPKSSLLLRSAGFLSKALPIVTIGASALSGARIVNDKGSQALVTTKEGRGAVLGAVGGALLLVPHPATQLAAAGVLGAVAVNQFGGMSRLDTLDLSKARSPASPGNPGPAPALPAPLPAPAPVAQQ